MRHGIDAGAGCTGNELDRRELAAGVDCVAFGLDLGGPGGRELLYQGVALGGGGRDDRLGGASSSLVILRPDESRAGLCQVALGSRELPFHQVGRGERIRRSSVRSRPGADLPVLVGVGQEP